MGHGASLLQAEEDEEHAQEIAAHLMEEIAKLKEQGKTDEEIKREMVQLLVQKKRHILQKKVETLQATVAEANIDELSREAHRYFKRNQALTFLVAVDGSKTADMAFKTIVSRRRRNDNVLVYHSFHPKSQDSKPHNHKMEAVKLQYETALISSIPTKHFYLCIDELKRTDDNREKVLFELIRHLRNQNLTTDPRIDPNLFGDHTAPDFLVMGYHGRKSEEILERRGIMGASADHVVREAHIPVILMKRPNKGEKRSFVMSVDASLRAKRALTQLLVLIRPKDSLTIIHVEESKPTSDVITSPSETKAYYEKEIEDFCPVDTKYISLVGEGSVVDLVSNKVDELDPDYLVLAPAASRNVSSVTETLMSKTSSNVILIKAHQK